MRSQLRQDCASLPASQAEAQGAVVVGRARDCARRLPPQLAVTVLSGWVGRRRPSLPPSLAPSGPPGACHANLARSARTGWFTQGLRSTQHAVQCVPRPAFLSAVQHCATATVVLLSPHSSCHSHVAGHAAPRGAVCLPSIDPVVGSVPCLHVPPGLWALCPSRAGGARNTPSSAFHDPSGLRSSAALRPPSSCFPSPVTATGLRVASLHSAPAGNELTCSGWSQPGAVGYENCALSRVSRP